MTAIPKPERQRDSAYLKWIRTQPCVLEGLDFTSKYALPLKHFCVSPIEANHIRLKGHGGLGTKPDDSRAVPQCRLSHDTYHDIGRVRFEQKYNIDLESEIKRLNRLYVPTTKVKRGSSSRIHFVSVLCECKREHRIKPVSFNFEKMHFYCPVFKTWKEVRGSFSAAQREEVTS